MDHVDHLVGCVLLLGLLGLTFCLWQELCAWPRIRTIPSSHVRHSPNPPKIQLRVCTFNHFLRPSGVSAGHDDYKVVRMESFAQHYLPWFDVLLLQEVFTSFGTVKSSLVELAATAGLLHTSGSFRTSNALVDSGLLVISRFPILRTEFCAFEKAAGVDRLASKGILLVEIELPPHERYLLFNTHMQAEYCYPSHGSPCDHSEAQESQWNQALEFVAGHRGPRMIWGGDFNFSGNWEKRRNQLKCLGFQSQVPRTERTSLRVWNCHREDVTEERVVLQNHQKGDEIQTESLDFMFSSETPLREGVQLLTDPQIPCYLLSDHRLVWAHF